MPRGIHANTAIEHSVQRVTQLVVTYDDMAMMCHLPRITNIHVELIWILATCLSLPLVTLAFTRLSLLDVMPSYTRSYS